MSQGQSPNLMFKLSPCLGNLTKNGPSGTGCHAGSLAAVGKKKKSMLKQKMAYFDDLGGVLQLRLFLFSLFVYPLILQHSAQER